MDNTYIKNDKQLFFNQIRGVIEELNDKIKVISAH